MVPNLFGLATSKHPTVTTTPLLFYEFETMSLNYEFYEFENLGVARLFLNLTTSNIMLNVNTILTSLNTYMLSTYKPPQPLSSKI